MRWPIHLQAGSIPFHPEAYDLADMGFIPAGAYRNREYAEAGVTVKADVSRAMLDLMYDPQTSGGLLMAVPERDAGELLRQLRDEVPAAVPVGYVTEPGENSIIIEA